MKKIFREIHLWLSIPVGLVFCMLCITGAMLVFEDETTDMVYSGMRQITPGDSAPLDVDAIKAKLTPDLPEGVEIKKVIESDSPDQAYKVQLSQPKGAAWYVNQYNAEKIGDCGRLPFFSKTMALHRWILDTPKDGASVGKKVVGWCTLASLVILLSGLGLWWPANKKQLSARLKIKGRSATTFWYTMHTVGGFYFLAALLVIVITGLTWSFGWWREMVCAVTGDMSFKSIHTGAFLGLASKIVWFVVAIAGAVLPITGYWLWIKRLRHHK